MIWNRWFIVLRRWLLWWLRWWGGAIFVWRLLPFWDRSWVIGNLRRGRGEVNWLIRRFCTFLLFFLLWVRFWLFRWQLFNFLVVLFVSWMLVCWRWLHSCLLFLWFIVVLCLEVLHWWWGFLGVGCTLFPVGCFLRWRLLCLVLKYHWFVFMRGF